MFNRFYVVLIIFLFPSIVLADDLYANKGESSSYFVRAYTSISDDRSKLNKGMAVSIARKNGACILLTAKHVVENTLKIFVAPWKNGPYKCNIRAKIIYIDKEDDFAFISIPDPTNCLEIINSFRREVMAGTQIHSYGEMDNKVTINKGFVSGYVCLDELGWLMVADIFNKEGFSGRGVFDEAENLIGLTIGETKRDNFSYILPISRINMDVIK